MRTQKKIDLADIETKFKNELEAVYKDTQLSVDKRKRKLKRVIDRAVDSYKNDEWKKVSDFTLSNFNICSILSHSEITSRQDFYPILGDLNAVFLSELYTDNSVSISVFDNLTTLNFRSHNYEAALHFIKKALEKEEQGERMGQLFDPADLQLRFRRRWLAALCYEYIGLDKLHNVSKKNAKGIKYLMKAMQLLIGNHLISEQNEVTAREYINLTFLLHSDKNLYNLLGISDDTEILPDEICDINWRGACLTNQVYRWFPAMKDSQISADSQGQLKTNNTLLIYDRFIEDISHTLAHCLSEYVKYKADLDERDQHTAQEKYFLRISELLIKHLDDKLGNKYVTCHATLLIERREYFSALVLLEQALLPIMDGLSEFGPKRTTEIEKKNAAHCISIYEAILQDYHELDENTKKKLRPTINEIALIAFYRWYYSVFSGNDDEHSKRIFKAYCDYANDPVASTYYNVINLKGLLIHGFQELQSGLRGDDLDCLQEIITDAHTDLISSRPGPTIHTDIWREWEALDIAFKAFCLWCTFAGSSDDAPLLCHRLYRLLIANGNDRDILTGDKTAPIHRAGFYLVETEIGSFIFRGNWERIDALLQQYKIDRIVFGHSLTELSSFLEAKDSRDIANVYLALDKKTLQEDATFLKNIIESDKSKRKNTDEKHSLFVDTSAIENTDIKNEFLINNKSLESMAKGNSRLLVFNSPELAFQFCITFSCLERLLSRLQAPLDSNLISPISEDETYIDQIGKEPSEAIHPVFLVDKDVEKINAVQRFKKMDGVIGSCFTSKKYEINTGKQFDFQSLEQQMKENTKLQCVVIFRFKEPNKAMDRSGVPDNPGESSSNNSQWSVSVDVFRTNSVNSTQNRTLISDTVVIEDGEDLIRAINNLCASLVAEREELDGQRYHPYRSTCPENNCLCLFARYSPEHTFDADFLCIQQYLYTFLGILFSEDIDVFIQKNPRTPKDENEYTMFVMKDVTLRRKCDFDTSICRSLRNVRKFVDSINVTEAIGHIPTMEELEQQLIPIDPQRQKYLFVSYRRNNDDPALCRPVYEDVLKLEKILATKTGNKLGVYIDVAQISTRIDSEIMKAIQDPNCIGAVVYSTAEYLMPRELDGITLKPESDDYCLDELVALNKRNKRSSSFKVFPVFFVTPQNKSNYSKSAFKEFVKEAVRECEDKHQAKRAKAIKALFACSSTYRLQTLFYFAQEHSSHYTKSKGFETALKDWSVIRDDKNTNI